MNPVPAKRGIRLNLKLARGVKRTRVTKVLSEAPGVESVIQTFPDETDEELARLYVLEVDPAEVDAAVRSLSDKPEVEYVEPTAPRRLLD